MPPLPAARLSDVACVFSGFADVPIFLSGLGTVQAFNSVLVKSRIDGQILKFNFTEGQIRQTVQAACSRATWEGEPATALTGSLLSQVGRSVATPNLGATSLRLA